MTILENILYPRGKQICMRCHKEIAKDEPQYSGMTRGSQRRFLCTSCIPSSLRFKNILFTTYYDHSAVRFLNKAEGVSLSTNKALRRWTPKDGEQIVADEISGISTSILPESAEDFSCDSFADTPIDLKISNSTKRPSKKERHIVAQAIRGKKGI
jgi:hypothetical protein